MLITGRDEETLFDATFDNLTQEGFIGYERLIMRLVHANSRLT